jgi:hypothetical protein|tara:strand:+ start:8570 stop:8947 length:378 start_codon:yes stop_codon:yes gene_type:complete
MAVNDNRMVPFSCYNSKVKFPTTLTVYGDIWKVKLLTPKTIERVFGMVLLGGVDFDTKIIRVDKTLPNELKWSVLLHEILHIAFRLCNSDGYVDGDHIEEQLVTRLEQPLFKILHENFQFGSPNK